MIDSPLNKNKEMTDSAVLRRYGKANELSIVTVSRLVFESLADIPKLLDERKKLLTRVEELEKIVTGGCNGACCAKD